MTNHILKRYTFRDLQECMQEKGGDELKTKFKKKLITKCIENNEIYSIIYKTFY